MSEQACPAAGPRCSSASEGGPKQPGTLAKGKENPHDKSMSLGQLALHVATVPGGVAQIALQSALARIWRAMDGEREVNVPVSSIYGPSADENPFLAREKSAVAV